MQAQISKAVLAQALLFGIKDALEACLFFFSLLSFVPPAHPPFLRSPDTIVSLVAYSRVRGKPFGLKSVA
jgi:hypothetical protein